MKSVSEMACVLLTPGLNSQPASTQSLLLIMLASQQVGCTAQGRVADAKDCLCAVYLQRKHLARGRVLGEVLQ